MHEYSKRIGEHIKSCYSDFGKMTREELDELKDWACVMKDLTEADINIRGIKAMDEAEQEEKFYGRMGYRGRAANGRFVHRSGRGRAAGYTPYMHMMDDGMDEYDMYDEMPYPMTGYRMGYTGGRGGNSGNMGNMGSRGGNSNSGNSGSYGYGDGDGRMGYGNVMKNYSKYGKAYDEYDRRRRHYTETKSPEDKHAMKESMNEIFSDMESMVENIMEYADASEKPELKQKIVQMAQKVQQMK